MGAKRKAARQKTFTHSNVVELNSFTKKKQSVTILPRNRNQEQYVLKLLEPSKDIVLTKPQSFRGDKEEQKTANT